MRALFVAIRAPAGRIRHGSVGDPERIEGQRVLFQQIDPCRDPFAGAFRSAQKSLQGASSSGSVQSSRLLPRYPSRVVLDQRRQFSPRGGGVRQSSQILHADEHVRDVVAGLHPRHRRSGQPGRPDSDHAAILLDGLGCNAMPDHVFNPVSELKIGDPLVPLLRAFASDVRARDEALRTPDLQLDLEDVRLVLATPQRGLAPVDQEERQRPHSLGQPRRHDLLCHAGQNEFRETRQRDAFRQNFGFNGDVDLDRAARFSPPLMLPPPVGFFATLAALDQLVVGEAHSGGDDILRVAVRHEDGHAERSWEKALLLRLGLLAGSGFLIVVTLAEFAFLDLLLGRASLFGRKETAKVPARRWQRQHFLGSGAVARFGEKRPDEIRMQRRYQVLADFDGPGRWHATMIRQVATEVAALSAAADGSGARCPFTQAQPGMIDSTVMGAARIPHFPGGYVEVLPDVCGGRPHIRGTRVKVSEVVSRHVYQGESVDDIVEALPQLTLAQVHAPWATTSTTTMKSRPSCAQTTSSSCAWPDGTPRTWPARDFVLHLRSPSRRGGAG